MDRIRRSTYLLNLLIPFAMLVGWKQAQAQMPKAEDKRYEDRYTFKHGKPFVYDPFIWAYTKEFADRFRMPEQWIEPELQGALAVAFRMTTIGDTTCGLAKKESNCLPSLRCQMDIYYDNSIQLPWNYPQYTHDTVVLGLSSSRYLHVTPDSKVRRYINNKDPNALQGIMNVGGGLVRASDGGWPSSIIYYDREYEPGVALIGYSGKGVCPSYAGPEEVSMPFSSNEDFQKFRNGQIQRRDIRIVHRIIFPRSFLERANAFYALQNKPVDEFIDGLVEQFFAAKRAAANTTSGRSSISNNNSNAD